MEEYDAIVVGGGPNGLTCAAYLCKAGAKTLVLDRKNEMGGGLSSDNLTSPFSFNLHATYMLLAELMPPYSDLELETKYCIRFIRPETQIAFLHKDGKALVFYLDPKKSAESIGHFSKKDGEIFKRMYDDFKQMADEILIPATYVPPLPPLDTVELLNKTELGKRLAEISEMSPMEIVDSYGFEDPRVKAALLYLGTIWGIHPDSRSTGYLTLLWIYRMMNAALVWGGGSHSLASALLSVIWHNGGNTEDMVEVERIILEDGTAKGVVTKDGREFKAKAIVSTLDPQDTFLKLVGRDSLPGDLAAATEMWEYEEWSLFTGHWGIKGDPPKYKAAEFNPDVNSALINVMGYESPDDIYSHIEDMTAGKLPEPAGHASCVTLHDAPHNLTLPSAHGPLHTLRWEGWSPYELADKHWDEVKIDYAQRCFEKWREYAPNLGEANILFKIGFSPLDIERRLVNMKRGSIKHGAYNMLQMGYLRPNESCSSYRTPIKGLYVGGSSVYPGGMILLGSGYNAAKVVAEDLGAKVWWTPPDYILKAQERGFLARS